MADIVLTTLNAKYIHASMGLRCLYANMGDLQPSTQICEYTIHQRPADIAEEILAHDPFSTQFQLGLHRSHKP